MTRASTPTWVAVGAGRIALGPRPSPERLRLHAADGATHVVTVQGEKERARQVGLLVDEADLSWLWVEVGRASMPRLGDGTELETRWRRGLDRAWVVLDGGGSLSVHCADGLHRTGMLAAALMTRAGIGREDSMQLLGAARPATARDLGPARLAWARDLAGGAPGAVDDTDDRGLLGDPDTIVFWSKSPTHREFSNYALYPFEVDGCRWPSVEHHYQAHKYSDPAVRRDIRQMPDPGRVKRYADRHRSMQRSDWDDDLRLATMERAVRAKFAAHDELRELLRSSGDRPLAEGHVRDWFWGIGPDGTGANHLGRILMAIRDELDGRG